MDAPTTSAATAEFEWPPASAIDPTIRQDAAALLGAARGRSSTMDAGSDAAAIVDAALDTRGRELHAQDEAALDDAQRLMLDFERRWWRQAGAKEQAIRDTFAMSPTRYYQTLNALLDLPGAVSYDAALTHRLRRLRGATARGRRVS